MDSVSGPPKPELVHSKRFRSRREAKAALSECLAIFRNRERRHASIRDRTPGQAGTGRAAARAAW